MASILKRSYVVKNPDGSPRLDKSGKPLRRQCRTWCIEFTGPDGRRRRHKGYVDKAATLQLAAKLERAVARGEQDLVDPFREHRRRPLAGHVADYVSDLRTAGRSAKYVGNVEYRLNILLDACGWATLDAVDAGSFLRWRETAKAKARKKGRALDSPVAGSSATTLNQYLEAANSFLNWCVRPAKRIPVNPLAGVDKVDGPKVRKRRALTDDEVLRLLGVAPAERKTVYRFALATGLRRSELEALQWGDVRLKATRPFLQLRAEATKARRGDVVYLPDTLAADLKALRPEGAADGDRVFPDVPDLELWRVDLAAAGIHWKDGMGRQADFHGGTRKTLCNRLHRNRVPLATAMRVMRHTDARLTLVDYADDDQLGVEHVLPELLARPATIDPAAGATGA